MPGLPGRCARQPQPRQARCAAIPAELLGVGLFLTPGLLTVAYALIRGKGSFTDGMSHVITQLSQGYLQPEAGGKNIPVAEGDLSEFTGSYIGFLYKM